jgi:hypothetical protein
MSWLKRISLVLLAIGLATVAWERKVLDEQRREQGILLAAKEEADRLLRENDELNAQQNAATNPGQEAHTELLRLRNEIRQLRLMPQEAERLRADHTRLAAQAVSSGPKLSESEGYLAKESWAEAGLGTPEAALQTFLRAMRDQDLPRLLSCLTEQGSRALGIRTDPATGQLRPESLEFLRFLNLISGARIEEQKVLEDGRILVAIRAVAGGEIWSLKFRKTGEEWKIDDH